MTRLILLAFILSINLTNVYGQNYIAQKQKPNSIRKAASHYYSNEDKIISDSMFITLNYYDKNEELIKKKETHYLKGKIQREYIVKYKTEEQLLEMYENGKLKMKNEFDDHGTIIKSMAHINNGKETLSIEYIPKYENEILTQKKIIEKNNLGEAEFTEYYSQKSFPDSTIVTSKFQKDGIELIGIKCYNTSKKLLSSKSIYKIPGNALEENYSIINKYDNQQNILEIKQYSNGQIVSTEKFHYENGKLSSSILQKKGILVKTVYEFSNLN